MIGLKKIQSIYGIYKKHGREAFLSAAEHYSDNVDWNSVEKTVSNMESTFYSERHNLTEAEKMVKDYNNGLTILNDNNSETVNAAPTMTM